MKIKIKIFKFSLFFYISNKTNMRSFIDMDIKSKIEKKPKMTIKFSFIMLRYLNNRP